MSEQQRRFDAIDISNETYAANDLESIDQNDLQDFLLDEPLPSDPGEISQVQEEAAPAAPVKPAVKKSDKPSVNAATLENYLLSEDQDDVDDDGDDIDQALDTAAGNKPEKNNLTGTIKPEKKKDKADTGNLPASPDDSFYPDLTTDLQQAGIFSDDSDIPVTDAGSFKNRFISEMEKGANNLVEQFLSHHGPEHREAFEAIFVKGLNPYQYYSRREQISDIENLDITKEENQERILRTFYESKGFSKEKIDSKISKLKDYGDLEEDAIQVHEVLLKEQKKQLEAEKQQAEEESYRREQQKLSYRTAVQDMLQQKLKIKDVDGIPLSPALSQKIFSNLTQDAYRLPDNRIITAFDKEIMELSLPENIEKKIKLALLLENNFDFSTIKKSAIKEETNTLFMGLEQKRKKRQLPPSPERPAYF